ncbi:hypothetical protein [Clostridium sp. BL-8]|uniref:hypothetical protein n=1 Tax=Clostridium sp. BL-8 TaxID=349938 RepID=UPI00098C1D8E|nr:hypothetical protein [Clostridium sp. BL-8]OOM74856.1 hypothetical protein CLOBL_41870 [Clostridium sp. BL-8]
MVIKKRVNKYIPEIIGLIFYIIFMIVIMYYHEPWFDEAQAWLIARDASLKEILFVLPHYEGHPPIWHLILLPFAKSGASFELSIKLISLTFCSIAMGLFIFKSPFKRIVRLTIPFTYFFFYQYGVISRPYCVLMLGFVLCSIFYKTKETNPFRFIITLGILCSASAYGIILSAGIAVVWLFEIFDKDFSLNRIKKIIFDKRFFALLILFVYSLILVISIIPKPDTYAINSIVKNNDYINRFIYMFFVLPGDATYLDICNYSTTKLGINIESALGIVGSSIISLLLIGFTKRNNKLLVLLVPYIFIGVFSTFIYFNTHHIGIITEFFLFVIWICLEDKKEESISFQFLDRLVKKESDIVLLKRIPKILFGIVILVSMIWTITASVNDIYVPYGDGRELAAFIKENNLDKYNIMAQWKQHTDNKTKKIVMDTNQIGSIAALPYFNTNIYYNFNNNLPNKSFIIHKVGNNDENIKAWKEIGFPDVIIGYPDLQILFGNSLSYKDYVCVYDAKGSYIWKTEVIDYNYPVYVKKDIMDQFQNLKEIDP